MGEMYTLFRRLGQKFSLPSFRDRADILVNSLCVGLILVLAAGIASLSLTPASPQTETAEYTLDLPAVEPLSRQQVEDIPLFSRAPAALAGETPAESAETAEVSPTPMQRQVIIRTLRPKIAVVIDDMGLNVTALRRLNAMPGPMTLSFLPYAQGLNQQARLAKAAGHEVFLHLPMEAMDESQNPGPQALRVNLDEQDLRRLVRQNLDQFEGFSGVNNHMGSRFTQSGRDMGIVLEELRARQLVFLDSKTSPSSVGSQLAYRMGMDAVDRDIFIDHVYDADFIAGQLARVEAIARRRGSAIAIGHPKGLTMDALQTWLQSLENKGFELVSVPELIEARKQGSLVAQVRP